MGKYFEWLCINKFSSLVKDKNSLTKWNLRKKIENLNGLKSIKNIDFVIQIQIYWIQIQCYIN